MNTIQLEPSPKAPRKILFNFNSLAEYEIITNQSALAFDKLGVKEMRVLAFVGFQEADPDFDLTLQDVGRLLNQDNLSKIMEAFAHDMSTADPEKK